MTPEDEELYRKYGDRLVRLAAAIVGPSDAVDVLSTAMVTVFTSRRWHAVENKPGYLHRAVVNESRKVLGRRSRREQRERLWASPDRVYPTEVMPEVRDAVAELSARQRAVVFLTYWADLDGRSVAELLGVSEGTVRRHLTRARIALRRTLDD